MAEVTFQLTEFLLLSILAALIIIINGFFVASEIALISIRPSRIEEMISNGNRTAKVLKYLKSQSDVSISTIQVGVSMASLATGIITSRYFEPLFINTFDDILPVLAYVEILGIGFSPASILIFLISTYILVSIGELVFKAIALQYPVMVSLVIAWPLRIVLIVFKPLVFLFNATASFIVGLFGIEFQQADYYYSEDEIKALLSESREAGVLLEEEVEILRRTFHLNDVIAGEIMTPRNEMEIINIDDPLESIVSQVIESGHSRHPVYEDKEDNFIGFLYMQDMLMLYLEELRKKDKKRSIRDIIRDLKVVPKTISGDKLLKSFQSSKKQIALVIDEFGIVLGIITLEDVIEVLVGDIQDIYDVEPPNIVESKEGIIINPQMSIEAFNEYFKAKIKTLHSLTVAGLLFEAFGHIPCKGEKTTIRDEDEKEFRFQVLETDGLRLEKIIIKDFEKTKVNDSR
jgi:putative hemolysin